MRPIDANMIAGRPIVRLTPTNGQVLSYDESSRRWVPSTPGVGSVSWGDIGGTIGNQSDLGSALAGKASSTHSHSISDVTGLQAALNGKAASAHSHAIGDTTGLQAALDGKAAATHTHAISDVTGLQSALDGKQASGSYAAASHTHATGDITGLGTMATQAASSVNITGGAIAGLSSLRSSGTGGIGYSTGAGGTAIQATNKSTGVTLNKTCGEITMNGAALAAGAIVSFTLTNNTIEARDVMAMNHVTTGTRGAYGINAQCGAGSAIIYVRNNTAGSLSEAIVIRFVVVKGVIA